MPADAPPLRDAQPRSPRRRALAWLALAAGLAALPGCLLAAGAAAGAGGFAYVNGNATGLVEASRADLADATRAVFDRHDVVITLDGPYRDHSHRIVGDNPSGRTVRAILETVREEGPASRLKLRVGLWGDRDASEALWHEIRKRAES